MAFLSDKLWSNPDVKQGDNYSCILAFRVSIGFGSVFFFASQQCQQYPIALCYLCWC